MKKEPTATCALRDRQIVSIERVYTSWGLKDWEVGKEMGALRESSLYGRDTIEQGREWGRDEKKIIYYCHKFVKKNKYEQDGQSHFQRSFADKNVPGDRSSPGRGVGDIEFESLKSKHHLFFLGFPILKLESSQLLLQKVVQKLDVYFCQSSLAPLFITFCEYTKKALSTDQINRNIFNQCYYIYFHFFLVI